MLPWHRMDLQISRRLNILHHSPWWKRCWQTIIVSFMFNDCFVSKSSCVQWITVIIKMNWTNAVRKPNIWFCSRSRAIQAITWQVIEAISHRLAIQIHSMVSESYSSATFNYLNARLIEHCNLSHRWQVNIGSSANQSHSVQPSI